ncbi:MAG: GH25 family lysozyme [bacterium]|jgi:GH25 family lysozyme M1 (1,4-beta-N-acetylmuramidase)|nr:GH25 family lysozyme [bacterium]
MTYPFGIDISKWQGINDYAKMKANTAFVFVKATESWGYTDPTFHTNWQGLVGHNRGAYCYVYPESDPLRQANHLIDIVKQVGADWKYDRLGLDLERSGHGLSKAEVSRRVLVMMERIKEVTGRYPILYSRKYWVQDNMLLTDPRLINADWWLAYYRAALPYPLYTPEMPSPPPLPIGVSKWLFHQTCEKGKGREVGVGSYYVDQNRFNGTKAELDTYFGRGEYSVYLPIVTVPEPEQPVEDNWAGLLRVQLWSQKDPRWGNDRMGSSGVLMKHQGCLVTNVANYLDYLGIDTDPKRYNNLLGSKGGYQYNYVGGIKYANMYWKYPGVLYPQIQRELTDYTWYWNGTGWQTQARSILASQRPVLALVDMYAGGELDQHWVLIVGERSGGWWAVDPDTGTLINLSKYGNNVYRIVGYRRKA